MQEFQNDLEDLHSLLLRHPPRTARSNIQNVVNATWTLLQRHIWAKSAINYKDTGHDDEKWHLDQLRNLRIVPWLISASKVLMSEEQTHANDGNDADDSLYDTVTLILSFLSGRGASSPIIKRFDFKPSSSSTTPVYDSEDSKNWTVWIREPSFAQSDIGWLTWGSAVVFSQLLVNDKLPIPTTVSRGGSDRQETVNLLELGCGTGLVGIMLAKWFENRQLSMKLTMTDYLDSLIDNCRYNISMNSPTTSSCGTKREGLQLPGTSLPFTITSSPIKDDVPAEIVAAKLDWRECLEDATDSSQLPRHSFECIVAADCIFDTSHSLLVPQIIHRYLAVTPARLAFPTGLLTAESAKLTAAPAIAIVLIPRRSHYKQELSLFEQEMSKLVGIELVEEMQFTQSQVLGIPNDDLDDLIYSLFMFVRK